MNKEHSAKKIGFTPWLLQRATSILIAITLFIHFWYQHFASAGEIGLWENVSARLGTFSYIILDGLMLAFLLFHALNGLRMVALDYSFFAKRERMVSLSLSVFGGITFILGLRALFFIFS